MSRYCSVRWRPRALAALAATPRYMKAALRWHMPSIANAINRKFRTISRLGSRSMSWKANLCPWAKKVAAYLRSEGSRLRHCAPMASIRQDDAIPRYLSGVELSSTAANTSELVPKSRIPLVCDSASIHDVTQHMGFSVDSRLLGRLEQVPVSLLGSS